MKLDEKRNGRLSALYDKALKGKYTKEGKFSWILLYNDAKLIGVSKTTAEDYADRVVERLQKGGYL